ncbi:hypothetical protein, partial [Streptococcus pneumoniae]|uniref:hypothetical protein n=1 Tax=Streptococcus pneumoniae TaxID=1313 RepID=UPI0018B033D6
MAGDVKSLVDALKAEAEASGTLDVASAFLSELGGSGAKAPDVADVKAAQSGIVNPQGMSLGEAVTKSAAYQEFLGQFRGADGVIKGNGI